MRNRRLWAVAAVAIVAIVAGTAAVLVFGPEPAGEAAEPPSPAVETPEPILPGHPDYVVHRERTLTAGHIPGDGAFGIGYRPEDHASTGVYRTSGPSTPGEPCRYRIDYEDGEISEIVIVQEGPVTLNLSDDVKEFRTTLCATWMRVA